MASDESTTVPLRGEHHLTDVDQVTELVDVDDVALVTDGERFRPVGVLGRGGMGEVRLVRDARIARAVAFKVLRRKFSTDASYRTRFLTEARIQGQLEHPSIVPVHDLGETGEGELFFSMKCVRGVTLREALADKKYTRRRLLTAFSSVCLAVEFAHSRGVVHRDLKPENVMLGDFGEVYVLDWGIAKVMHAADAPLTDSLELPGDSAATRAGVVLGTPNYMAPERRHGTADGRSDVYSLGLILNELLSAHRAYIAPELVAIVERACALDPSARFPTARELHDALEAYLDGDRDLEARKKLADDHAGRAVTALEQGARSTAGHEVGRALGLDPGNERALRTLMELLGGDVPDRLPPEADAEYEQRWRERRARTLRASTIWTCALLLYVPLVLWMGVRDANLLAAFIAATFAAIGTQYAGSRSVHWLPQLIAFAFMQTSAVLMATSLGPIGAVPATLTILAMAWRMNVQHTYQGVLILVVSLAALGISLALMTPQFTADGAIVLRPQMNDLPPTATMLSLIISAGGAIAIAVLYGRTYSGEIRRAERRLVFQAWQLRQLLPPSP